MFYLLKSTNDREKTGDVVLLLSEVEGMSGHKITTDKETWFQLRVSMKSDDGWKVNFNTEDELKQEMKNLGVPDAMVSEFTIQIKDIEEEKKEVLESLMKKMMG